SAAARAAGDAERGAAAASADAGVGSADATADAARAAGDAERGAAAASADAGVASADATVDATAGAARAAASDTARAAAADDVRASQRGAAPALDERQKVKDKIGDVVANFSSTTTPNFYKLVEDLDKFTEILYYSSDIYKNKYAEPKWYLLRPRRGDECLPLIKELLVNNKEFRDQYFKSGIDYPLMKTRAAGIIGGVPYYDFCNKMECIKGMRLLLKPADNEMFKFYILAIIVLNKGVPDQAKDLSAAVEIFPMFDDNLTPPTINNDGHFELFNYDLYTSNDELNDAGIVGGRLNETLGKFSDWLKNIIRGYNHNKVGNSAPLTHLFRHGLGMNPPQSKDISSFSINSSVGTYYQEEKEEIQFNNLIDEFLNTDVGKKFLNSNSKIAAPAQSATKTRLSNLTFVYSYHDIDRVDASDSLYTYVLGSGEGGLSACTQMEVKSNLQSLLLHARNIWVLSNYAEYTRSNEGLCSFCLIMHIGQLFPLANIDSDKWNKYNGSDYDLPTDIKHLNYPYIKFSNCPVRTFRQYFDIDTCVKINFNADGSPNFDTEKGIAFRTLQNARFAIKDAKVTRLEADSLNEKVVPSGRARKMIELAEASKDLFDRDGIPNDISFDNSGDTDFNKCRNNYVLTRILAAYHLKSLVKRFHFSKNTNISLSRENDWSGKKLNNAYNQAIDKGIQELKQKTFYTSVRDNVLMKVANGFTQVEEFDQAGDRMLPHEYKDVRLFLTLEGSNKYYARRVMSNPLTWDYKFYYTNSKVKADAFIKKVKVGVSLPRLDLGAPEDEKVVVVNQEPPSDMSADDAILATTALTRINLKTTLKRDELEKDDVVILNKLLLDPKRQNKLYEIKSVGNLIKVKGISDEEDIHEGSSEFDISPFMISHKVLPDKTVIPSWLKTSHEISSYENRENAQIYFNEEKNTLIIPNIKQPAMGGKGRFTRKARGVNSRGVNSRKVSVLTAAVRNKRVTKHNVLKSTRKTSLVLKKGTRGGVSNVKKYKTRSSYMT
ncbi:MAG: hypothetical protein CBB97_14810, partial [Candidatus Endolissoclinum sp. TMED37]